MLAPAGERCKDWLGGLWSLVAGRRASDSGGTVACRQAYRSRENVMPIVRVEMFPGRTHAQKQELARAITEAVANIAHTTPEATMVGFQEVERESWAQAGKLASDEEPGGVAGGVAGPTGWGQV